MMIKKRLQVYQISTKCIIIQEIIEIINQNTLIAYLNYDIVRIYQLNEYYGVKDERPIK